jgi:NADH-quinone oxidoreductase subunit L
MCAGSVMHALHDELDIRKMGGLRNKLRFTYFAFLVGVLAIIGFPGFSGFFSKEDVIGAAYTRALHGDSWLWIVWALTILTACLTAAYMFRLFFLVFHGEPRDRQLYEQAHEPGLAMRAPMAVLMVLSVFGGFLAFPGAYNKMEDWLSPVFTRFPVNGPTLAPQPFAPVSMIATLLATLIGFGIAWQIYYKRQPNSDRVAARAPAVYRFLYHKYYVDELYDFLFVQPIKFTGRMLNQYFDTDIVDGAVDGVGKLLRLSSSRLRRVQTGYVRNYALSILLGAVLMVGFSCWGR